MVLQDKETMYDYLYNSDIPDGDHSMVLANDTSIDFEIVNYTDDKVFSSDERIGSSAQDGKMVVIKCHKNCTIEEGVTLTPSYRKKGFVLIVKGILENKGTISMTARGAKATGDELILYGNKDRYEVIPAQGGSGAEKVGGKNGVIAGKNGAIGTSRKTGGGGGGGYYSNYSGSWAGAGASGTSYSGGSGGGATSSYDATQIATAGAENGGPGGNAACRRTSANDWTASGGAGNGAGTSAYRTDGAGTANRFPVQSKDGTGGLLIIFSNIFINDGVIESKGSDTVDTGHPLNRCTSGGASGGGSINIFYSILTKEGEISAAGGKSAKGCVANGGDGGDGCITLTQAISIDASSFVAETDLYDVVKEVTIGILKKVDKMINGGQEEGKDDLLTGITIKKYDTELATYDDLLAIDFSTLDAGVMYLTMLTETKAIYLFTKDCNATDVLPVFITNRVIVGTDVPTKQEFDDLKNYLKYNVVDGKTYIVTPLNDAGIEASVDDSFTELGEKIAILARLAESGSTGDSSLEVNGAEEVTVKYAEAIPANQVVKIMNVENQFTYMGQVQNIFSLYLNAPVTKAKLSSDGNILAISLSSTVNGSYVHIYKYDKNTKKFIYKVAIPDLGSTVNDISLSDTGRIIALTYKSGINVYSYDLDEGITKFNMEIKGTNTVPTVDIYKDKYIVFGFSSSPYFRIYKIDIENDTATMLEGYSPITASYTNSSSLQYSKARFTHDGKYAVMNSWTTNGLYVISVDKPIWCMYSNLAANPYAIDVSPINYMIAVTKPGAVQLLQFNPKTNSIELLSSFDVTTNINVVQFSRDGKYLFIHGNGYFKTLLINGGIMTEIDTGLTFVTTQTPKTMTVGGNLLIVGHGSSPYLHFVELMEPAKYAYIQRDMSIFGKAEGIAITREMGTTGSEHKVLQILKA